MDKRNIKNSIKRSRILKPHIIAKNVLFISFTPENKQLNILNSYPIF